MTVRGFERMRLLVTLKGVLLAALALEVGCADWDSLSAGGRQERFGGRGEESGEAIAVNAAGQIVVAGGFHDQVEIGGTLYSTRGSADIFVMVLDRDLRLAWSKQLGDLAADIATGAAIDGAGNVYVSGRFGGTVDFGADMLTAIDVDGHDGFVASFTATGSPRWARAIAAVDGPTDLDWALTAEVDGAGNVYVAGVVEGETSFGGPTPLPGNGEKDAYIASYTTDGTYRWAKRFGGTGTDSALAIAAEPSGGVYLGGYFDGPVSFGGETFSSDELDAYVVRLDADGEPVWARSFGGPGYDVIYALAAGLSGLFVGGQFAGSIDLGGGPITGAADGFVAAFSPDGGFRWSQSLGGDDCDYVTGLALDDRGELYAAGRFVLSGPFGGRDLVARGDGDGFVARLDAASGSARWIDVVGAEGGDAMRDVAVGAGHAAFASGYVDGAAACDLDGTSSADILVYAADPR